MYSGDGSDVLLEPTGALRKADQAKFVHLSLKIEIVERLVNWAAIRGGCQAVLPSVIAYFRGTIGKKLTNAAPCQARLAQSSLSFMVEKHLDFVHLKRIRNV